MKIGDKVMVRKDLIGGNYYSCGDYDLYFNKSMECYRGKIGTVAKIEEEFGKVLYRLDIVEGNWVFSDSMLLLCGSIKYYLEEEKCLK